MKKIESKKAVSVLAWLMMSLCLLAFRSKSPGNPVSHPETGKEAGVAVVTYTELFDDNKYDGTEHCNVWIRNNSGLYVTAVVKEYEIETKKTTLHTFRLKPNAESYVGVARWSTMLPTGTNFSIVRDYKGWQ